MQQLGVQFAAFSETEMAKLYSGASFWLHPCTGYIVMAYIAMAYIVMAFVVVAKLCLSASSWGHRCTGHGPTAISFECRAGLRHPPRDIVMAYIVMALGTHLATHRYGCDGGLGSGQKAKGWLGDGIGARRRKAVGLVWAASWVAANLDRRLLAGSQTPFSLNTGNIPTATLFE